MVLRLLGYVFVFAVLAFTLIVDYPPKPDLYGFSTAALFILAPFALYPLLMARAAFWLRTSNVYVIASWLSVSLLLYVFTKAGILTGLSGALIYIVFVLVGVGVVGLLNIDKPKNIVLQHEPVEASAFVRGITYGVISFALALGVASTVATIDYRTLIVGPVSYALADVFAVGVEFLLALFIVAVPEELMARVFYFKFGSAVLDPMTAVFITTVVGYAMHAVTRYGIEYASAVLLIITAVWTIFTAAYIRHGLLASVAAHAVYNTMIAALTYGYTTMAIMLAVFAVPIIYYALKRKPIL